MSTGGCGDASVVQGTAVELFQLAALLTGDQAEAVRLVEETLASVEIDPCLDPAAARRLGQQELLTRAIEGLRVADPASFAPAAGSSTGEQGCVRDEDLSQAGVSHAQLTEWLASAGRQDLRDWLAALPAAQRAIFVQRAVLGQDNAATAEKLQVGDAVPAAWTPEGVGEVYRLALCSLANSLAHSPGGMVGSEQAHLEAAAGV